MKTECGEDRRTLVALITPAHALASETRCCCFVAFTFCTHNQRLSDSESFRRHPWTFLGEEKTFISACGCHATKIRPSLSLKIALILKVVTITCFVVL